MYWPITALAAALLYLRRRIRHKGGDGATRPVR
jgi:hypothetical protein